MSGERAGERPDQRATERRALELPVQVSDAESRAYGTIEFDTRDLSIGGAFLRSDLLFDVGEVLDLEFNLPTGTTVQGRGRVVRVARDPSPTEVAGMGIAFIDLPESDRLAIRTFLSRD